MILEDTKVSKKVSKNKFGFKFTRCKQTFLLTTKEEEIFKKWNKALR